jgi:general secretion pathway protein L
LIGDFNLPHLGASIAMRRSPIALLPSLYAAWRWWSGEIASFVPKSWRENFAAGRGKLVLALIGDGTAELVQRSAGREETVAHLDLAPARLAQARATVAAVQQRQRRGIGAALRLPADTALSATMALPLAAEANLDQVVAFELDRRTPFKREEVYHAQRVLQRDAVAKRLSVQLTVVPRLAVDQALALAERLGIAPERVEVEGEPAGNLLPARPQSLAARLPSLAFAALALLAVMLAGAAALVPLERSHRAVIELRANVAESKRLADESLRLQKEIDAEIQESGFLAARKRQVPSASEILLALTQMLPDDTWLSELEISAGEVRLTGFAESASSILGLIDQSPRFANAAFRSPVTQDQRSKRELFNIAAKVARERAP